MCVCVCVCVSVSVSVCVCVCVSVVTVLSYATLPGLVRDFVGGHVRVQRHGRLGRRLLPGLRWSSLVITGIYHW